MISIDGLHHGGAERVVQALCKNLDKDKFHVIVCWTSGQGAIGEELISHGYEVIGIPEIDPNGLSRYEKILNNKNGIAVVPVIDTACSGCQMKLNPQMINLVKMQDRLVECDMCSRILYFEGDL